MIDLFKVSEVESSRRMDICKQCEFLKGFEWRNVVYPKCSQCGCFMNLKTKLIGMKCPKGKW
jgi:hypothetical protein